MTNVADGSGEHRVELGEGWSLWRWIFLRGAGFPAAGVLQLAAPRTVRLADELDSLAHDVSVKRTRVLEQLDRLIDSAPEDVREHARKARRKLRPGRALDTVPGLAEAVANAPALGDALHALSALEAHIADRTRELAETFSTEREAAMQQLEHVARDPRFREAVTWQNRHAIGTGVDRLLARPRGRFNVSDRNHEQLVASYLSRYSVKNDTIGFFGPVGWASVSRKHTESAIRAGRELLAKRTVYFEHWCIDALAQQFSADPELRPFMRPRRMPTVLLDGTTIRYRASGESPERAVSLPPVYATVLAACDGARTAREIAADVIDPELGLHDEHDVFLVLGRLAERKLCTWAFEITTVNEWPERDLRAQLAPAAGEAGDRARAVLDELEQARDAVARAAGDPAALDAAFAALEATFERLTSESATRRGGQAYAGRTLVFEECSRAVDAELGASALDQLARPLQLMLHSARWYTYELARAYREELEVAFATVTAHTGAASVDYPEFWRHARALFPDDHRDSTVIARVDAELQRKWRSIIPLDRDARHVDVRVADIRDAVAREFAAPHPGWPGARYHSPDLMIAAPRADALGTDAASWVLGEFHPAVCTIHFFAQKMHDERAEMIRARELDLPEVIPSLVISKEVSSRADHMWLSSQDIDIELGTTRSWRPRESVIAVASLVVEKHEGRLVVRERDGERCFDAIEFFGHHMSAMISGRFSIFESASHMPRVAFDRLIVSRETWRVPTAELAAAHAKEPLDRFIGIRRWANERGLPRWVFAKVVEEPKPIYVDFEAPTYVEALCRILRKATDVTFSEMLPAIDQTWLPDAAGRTYTSELRVVIVDPTRWTAPSQ